MKGYNFETFRVQEGNQIAYEMCRAVAALAYAGPQPIILLGPRGAGKSHLLWAIVHEVRGSTAKAGLGLVMAKEFPEAVRGLVQNPAPIQSGKPAILLVDELEHFQDNASDLEAVVQVFLNHGHSVVLASSVDPDRLVQFSQAFKELVRQGHLVEIRPPIPAGGNEDTAGLRSELDDARAEIARLRAQLEEAGAKRSHEPGEATGETSAEQTVSTGDSAAEIQALRERLEAAEAAEATALEEQSRLEAYLRAKESIENTLKDVRAERDAALAALRQYEETAQSLFQQVESRRAAVGETFKSLTEQFRNHLHRWRAPAGQSPAEERESLETALNEARSLASAFREQMELERQQFDAALGEVRKERDHAEMLLEQSHAEQGRLKVALDGLRGRLEALDRELESAREAAVLQASEMEVLRGELAAQKACVAERSGELEQAREAISRQASEMETLRNELAAQKACAATQAGELENARKTIAIQIAEMDALRHEAAAQVASANMQAGEMEGRAARLQTALEAAVNAARATETETLRHRETLLQVAESLRLLSERHESVKQPEPEALRPVSPEDRQAFLFDAVPEIEPLEAPRLEAFAQGFMPAGGELPGSGPSLRDAVDAALSPPSLPSREE